MAYPLQTGSIEALILLGLWFSGVLVVGLWLSFTGYTLGIWVVAAVALALSTLTIVAPLWRAWHSNRKPAAWLAWDGQQWHCGSASSHSTDSEAATSGWTVFVVLDWQVFLLLCLSRPGLQKRKQWLWLSRRSLPDRWLDVRRAVVARARQPAA